MTSKSRREVLRHAGTVGASAGLGTLGIGPASGRSRVRPGGGITDITDHTGPKGSIATVTYPEEYGGGSHGGSATKKVFDVGEIWRNTQVKTGSFNVPCGENDNTWYTFRRSPTRYNSNTYVTQMFVEGSKLKNGAKVRVSSKTDCSDDPNWKIYDLRVL